MDDGGRKAVQVDQHLEDLGQPAHEARLVHGHAAGHHLAQGVTLDEGLHQHQALVGEVVHVGGDVGVVEPSQHRDFTAKKLEALGIFGAADV